MGSDFFIHNGDSFLPEYIPGIIGYGQNGAPGSSGEDAPSVYYSSLNLENSKEYKLAQKRILNKQQLSNNITVANDSTYKVNDLIVDRSGQFYRITKLNDTEVLINLCANTSAIKYSPITTSFCGYNVRCSTSFLKSSDKKWIKENPNYNPELIRLDYSPKIYHHNRLEKYVYGNSITFNLIPTPGADISNYTYKFVLVLPNGQTFEYYSSYHVSTIFLENKLLFGCFSNNEWEELMNFKATKVKETSLSRLIGNDNEDDLEMKVPEESLGSFTKIDHIKYENDEYTYRGTNNKIKIIGAKGAIAPFNNDLFDSSNNSTKITLDDAKSVENDINTFSSNYDHLEDFLSAKEITILLSYFIKHECTSYCEITDTKTGVVYRVDINDIFVTENLTKNDNRIDYIKETMNNVSWDKKLISDNIDINNTFSNFLTYTHHYIDSEGNDSSVLELFNPMNSYIMLSTKDGNSNTLKDSISEDGIIEKLYFVDANGFTKYLETNPQSNQEGGLDGIYYNLEYARNTLNLNDSDDDAVNGLIKDLVCQQWNVRRYSEIITTEEDGIIKNNIIERFSDSNKVIKLSFSSLSSIKINIKYEKNLDSFPQAMIYIGYIDHPLIVLNPDYDKLAEEGKDPGEEPGIYYLTKFVPPGYYINENESDYTKTALAGVTESTINLSDFNINDTKTHYIEIGVVLLNTEGKTRKEINETHRKSCYTKNSDEYRLFFLDENTSGDPDIKLFVSGVQELTDEELSRNEDDEFNLNDFNTIHCDKPKDIYTYL